MAMIIIVLMPGIYFGYNLVKQEEFEQKANQYILNVSHFEFNLITQPILN